MALRAPPLVGIVSCDADGARDGKGVRQNRREQNHEETVHARVATLKANSGKQAGDPYQAAEATIKVVQSSDPPLRLVLGKFGVERIRAKWEAIQREMGNGKR